jgi:hypothetical protein
VRKNPLYYLFTKAYGNKVANVKNQPPFVKYMPLIAYKIFPPDNKLSDASERYNEGYNKGISNIYPRNAAISYSD